MAWRSGIRRMAHWCRTVLSVCILVLTVLFSPAVAPDVHATTPPVETVALVLQDQQPSACDAVSFCAIFVAPAEAKVAVSRQMQSIWFGLNAKAALTQFRPVFNPPPPRV